MSRWRSVTAGEIVVPGQVDDLDDRHVQAQTPLADQLQRGHRREQLRDRRGIEPGSQRHRHRPRRLAQPYAPETPWCSPRRISTTPENRSPAARPQPPIQLGEGHEPTVRPPPRGSQPAPERLAPCPGGTRRGRRRGGRPARRHGHAGTPQRRCSDATTIRSALPASHPVHRVGRVLERHPPREGSVASSVAWRTLRSERELVAWPVRVR